MSDSGIAREKANICEGIRALKERFEGTAGRRLLIDTLKTQKMVAGNSDLAQELAGLVEVIDIKAGESRVSPQLWRTKMQSCANSQSLI